MAELNDDAFMAEALKEAQKAESLEEVPIGAVFVRDGVVVARGHNLREAKHDATSHAEIEVIRSACEALGAWRLGGSLYVTLEPCPMCVGAILQARIQEVIFACPDPKAGALGSIVNLNEGFPWNHRFAVRSGVMEEASRDLLQNFFRKLRT